MRVLIVGAGVGGLTLARCLTRAGISAKVFDSLPADTPRADRGLGLWDAAQGILTRTLGDTWMREHAHLIPPASYRNESGAWLSQASASPSNVRRVATLREGELLAALRQEAVSVAYGKEVVAVEEKAGGVVVRFADGGEEEGTLVVGADGCRSAVRRCRVLALPHSA